MLKSLFGFNNIKEAQMAGFFYPKEAWEIDNLIKKYFANISSSQIKKKYNIKGLIVPHAGYIYSGQCAAYGYYLLKESKLKINNIYIFGTAHNFFFKGLKTAKHNAFNTPIGSMKLDKKNIKFLSNQNIINIDNKVFDKEHSIEVQLPFLIKSNMYMAKIIPILVGQIDISKLVHLFNYIDNQQDSIFIISSDLSHYKNYDSEQSQDRHTIYNVENLNINKISLDDACCAKAVIASTKYAKINNYKIKNIFFSNSSQISQDKNSVVGYGSFVIYNNN